MVRASSIIAKALFPGIAILQLFATPSAGASFLVALAPNNLNKNGTSDSDLGTFQWVNVSSSESVQGTDDVSLNLSISAEKKIELGNLASYTPSGKLSLTAKMLDNSMYSLLQTQILPTGINQANVLEVVPQSGERQTHDLEALVQQALNNTDAHATHTFDVSRVLLNNYPMTLGLFIVEYPDATLGIDVLASAIVAIDLETMTIVPTADNKTAFLPLLEIGTWSTAESDTIFKMQYYREADSAPGPREEYHMNGITIFELNDKSWLAFTHKAANEAIIIENPWTNAVRGGERYISQRFGTPALDTSKHSSTMRHFGVDQNEEFNGVHNLYFSSKSATFEDKPTLCMFINDRNGNSTAVEFVVDPVLNHTAEILASEETFPTNYTMAPLPYQCDTMGGVMALGSGVYLVASGSSINNSGLGVIDREGVFKHVSYTLDDEDATASAQTKFFYDPFIITA